MEPEPVLSYATPQRPTLSPPLSRKAWIEGAFAIVLMLALTSVAGYFFHAAISLAIATVRDGTYSFGRPATCTVIGLFFCAPLFQFVVGLIRGATAGAIK